MNRDSLKLFALIKDLEEGQQVYYPALFHAIVDDMEKLAKEIERLRSDTKRDIYRATSPGPSPRN